MNQIVDEMNATKTVLKLYRTKLEELKQVTLNSAKESAYKALTALDSTDKDKFECQFHIYNNTLAELDQILLFTNIQLEEVEKKIRDYWDSVHG